MFNNKVMYTIKLFFSIIYFQTLNISYIVVNYSQYENIGIMENGSNFT